MNNFTAVLYKTIGNRIRRKRQEAKLTQDDLYPSNRSLLSQIESGIAKKKRNPHFINDSQIRIFSEHSEMRLTPYELVWGTPTEKTDLIKLWILSILLNDKSNPFFDGTITEWIDKELKYLPYRKRDSIYDNIEEFTKTYGFFFIPERHKLYELLEPAFDSKYEELSHLILKQIMQDYDFSKHFINRLFNYSRNINIMLNFSIGTQTTNEDVATNTIENFILGKDSYGFIILDMDGIRYPEFLVAFTKFWNKVESTYMSYFEKYLFLKENVLLTEGIAVVNNNKIHDIFLSKEFIEMNKQLLLLPEYTENEAILSSLYLRFRFIFEIQKARVGKENWDKEFTDLFKEIRTYFEQECDLYFKSLSNSNEDLK